MGLVVVHLWREDLSQSLAYSAPQHNKHHSLVAQALHIVWPLVAIGAVINVMHFYMTDMYIFGVAGWRGLGFAGTGLALATSRTLLLFFLFLYAPPPLQMPTHARATHCL